MSSGRPSSPRPAGCRLDRFTPDTGDFFPGRDRGQPLERHRSTPALVHRCRHAVLAHRSDGRTAARSRALRRCQATREEPAGALRAGVAGGPLRGAGDGVSRVPRRLRRPHPRRARPRRRRLRRRGEGADLMRDADRGRSLRAASRAHMAGRTGALRVSKRPGRLHAQLAICHALLDAPSDSRVAGRFAVAPMPGGAGGAPTAALGGSQLAINAYSDDCRCALPAVDYLLAPEQMLERARVDRSVSRRARRCSTRRRSPRRCRWIRPRMRGACIDAARAASGDARSTAQLSEILQVALHRALTRQQEPEAALREAADRACRRCSQRVRLAPSAS